MNEKSQSYNLRTLREPLQTAFTIEHLRGLFGFKNHDINPVTAVFADAPSTHCFAANAALSASANSNAECNR